jgi:hypothetical protein
MAAGALAGLVLSASIRSNTYNPGFFLSCVLGAWAAIGLYALVRGEVTLGGRGGRGAMTTMGWKARAVGLVILASGVAFILVMRSTAH